MKIKIHYKDKCLAYFCDEHFPWITTKEDNKYIWQEKRINNKANTIFYQRLNKEL